MLSYRMLLLLLWVPPWKAWMKDRKAAEPCVAVAEGGGLFRCPFYAELVAVPAAWSSDGVAGGSMRAGDWRHCCRSFRISPTSMAVPPVVMG